MRKKGCFVNNLEPYNFKRNPMNLHQNVHLNVLYPLPYDVMCFSIKSPSGPIQLLMRPPPLKEVKGVG
jgi:hypothetical protein